MPSWFKRDEKLPPELEGKSPEDVVKSLKEAEELKTRLTALEGERVTEREQVTTLTNQFNEVKTRLQAAEANNNRQPPKPPEELVNFVEDGDKAFQQRVGPIADLAVRNAISTARMLAQQQLNNQDMNNGGRTMDGRLFQAWGQEIDQDAKKYASTAMMTPQAWIGIYMMIKGIHSDELADPEVRKKKYNFLESGRSGAPPPPEVKNEDVLTDQEKHVADKMGVKYEDYLKRKKSMQFVNA